MQVRIKKYKGLGITCMQANMYNINSQVKSAGNQKEDNTMNKDASNNRIICIRKQLTVTASELYSHRNTA